MPFFQYKAIGEAGAEVTDVMEAADPTVVAEQLERLGYLPVHIIEKRRSGGLKLLSGKRKIKQQELIVFTKQMVTMLKAGVPLLATLEALVEQTENEALRELLRKIYGEIESGSSFSDALQHHPDVFSELYINSIHAGEVGGALDAVLERLAQLMAHDHETRQRIKSAMRYPMIVVVSLIVAFITLMIVVVPNFIDLFNKMNVPLPLPTRILIGIHGAIVNYWHLLLAAVGAVGFALNRYKKTEKGAYQWDRMRIALPVLGELNMKTAMSRFTRMFETLNSSGLPILQTLEITSRTVGNAVIGKELEKVSYGILQGEGLAGPLSNSRVFPPMVTRMISIGEQSGSLDDMLLNVSQHYDTEVDYAIKNMTSMIEPILTVAMGIMVLFLALAIFLPMWDLTNLVQ